MFTVGQHYTRHEIHNSLGGSKQAYLPTKKGAVLAACLTRRMNPLAPRVVLCGRGPRIQAAGELLASQAGAIPVFVKRDVNRWEYHGPFRPAASFTTGSDFERYLAGSGRAPRDVSRVVLMEPASE